MPNPCHIPFEIRVEIMKKLPVKSLIPFRSISKPWKSLIDSSEFIADHSANQTRPHHLLVSYGDELVLERNFVSIVDDDDDSYSQKKVSVIAPMSLKSGNLHHHIIGISQGLFCLYNSYKPKQVIMWNPSIRQLIAIDVPDVFDWPYKIVIGFGVCPQTSDPKLVNMTLTYNDYDTRFVHSIAFQVCTLGSRTRRSLSTKLSRRSIHITSNQVDINELIYWSAYEFVYVDDKRKRCNTIISFDMTTEEFKEVNLPNKLKIKHGAVDIPISKLRDSVDVLEYNHDAERRVCGVWIMEHGVSRSFKVFNIYPTDISIRKVIGFRNNGEPIIEIHTDNPLQSSFAAYEIYSKQIKDLGIYGTKIFLCSYVETLLLLDR